MAQELCGPEPNNIQEFHQTAETSNMEKLEEEIGIDPLDFFRINLEF